MKLSRLERGDTIVEVLIAIIIVSSVLTGAYTTARLGLTAERQSQERSEGLKLVEGQVEGLRASTANADSPIFKQTNVFCFSSTNAPQSAFSPASASPQLGKMTAIADDTAASYSATCSHAATVSVADITYNLSIDACDSVNAAGSDCSGRGICGSTDAASGACSKSQPSLFIARARWDRAGGGGREDVTLLYRVYPLGSAVIPAAPVPGGGDAGIGCAGCSGGSATAQAHNASYYFYSAFLTNKTPNASGFTPVSCTWSWGTGQGSNTYLVKDYVTAAYPNGLSNPNDPCVPGGPALAYHCYYLSPVPSSPPPSPTYNVVLTMFYAEAGKGISDAYSISLPYGPTNVYDSNPPNDPSAPPIDTCSLKWPASPGDPMPKPLS